MNVQEFKNLVNTRIANELPVVNQYGTTGELKELLAKARAIIETEAKTHGYNPAAFSTRAHHGKSVIVV